MWGLVLTLLGLVNLSPTALLVDYIGASDAALKLFLSLLMTYPIAIVYHEYVRKQYKNNYLYKHAYFIIMGLDIAFYNFGLTLYHCVIPILVIYATTALLGPTKYNTMVTFAFNMCYLLTGYYMTESEDYDITWTMPQCVLTLKLIALSFDLWDGSKNQETLSANNKKTALNTAPNLVELFGFVFFPTCFLVGPIFSLRRYLDFVEEKFPLDNDEKYKKLSLERLALGVSAVIAHQIGVAFFNVKYMQSDEFYDHSIFYRHFYCGMWAHFALYKYISCWLLCEASCIRFGLSFNGKERNSEELRWDGCRNIQVARFLTATKFQHYIDSFNCNTNHFAAEYVYKRLRFLGNRNLSQLLTLVFLAVWHGITSGYYVTFLNEFLIILMEKELESMIGKLVIYEKVWSNIYMKYFLIFMLKMYTIVFMGWSLIPFDLKVYSKWYVVYKSLFFSGFVLFLPWAFAYKRLVKFAIRKYKLQQIDTGKHE